MADATDPVPARVRGVPLAVLEATRSLLWVQSSRDARRVAVDLVRALGADLVAAGSSDPDVGRPLEVTFSAGIAPFTGDAETTLRLADDALYRAKDAGRDRWLWAEGRAPEVEEPTSYVEPYLGDAVVGNRRPAVDLILGLRDHRVPEADIVEDLLAVAQREVGERWYRNELSPAYEHLASGVAMAALDALAGEMPPPTRDGLVVVACAEGDWHSLSAQMFGEALRASGFDVSVLGASTPAAAVVDFLTRAGGDSLAVSCNMPIFFPGVARLINAAHEIGVPVIVGGRAFGDDDRRAARLGADAWATGASDAAETLADWHAHRPQIGSEPVRLDETALHMFAASSALATAALGDLTASPSPILDLDADQVTHLHENLVFVVQFLAAARLVADDSIFEHFLVWLDELFRTRGLAPEVLAAGLKALTPRLIGVDPDTTRLLEAAPVVQA